MRSVTAVLRQAGGFHPISQSLTEETAFTKEGVHQFNILADGTAVVLCQVRGDLDRARQLIDGHPAVLSYSISSGDEGEGLIYTHTAVGGH